MVLSPSVLPNDQSLGLFQIVYLRLFDESMNPFSIVLRSQGNYFIAFLVPAILMAIALILFLLGSKYYTRNMPTGNIFAQFLGATWAALRGKCKGVVSSVNIFSPIWWIRQS